MPSGSAPLSGLVPPKVLPESPPRACFRGWSATRIATEGANLFCERWGRGRAHRLSFSSWDFHSFSRRVLSCASPLATGTTSSIAPVPIATCVVRCNFRSIRNGSAGLVSLAATASTFAYLAAERLILTLGNHRSFASASIDFPLLAPSPTFIESIHLLLVLQRPAQARCEWAVVVEAGFDLISTCLGTTEHCDR
ncbi:uncharacterized protein Triagg1_9869 [Trichoderma aggressivum f. europaeum]|uniref:Uncharacterized protein n=1 Tax=Trichoderma aggressivum f. europaeum TaxID=173218 RepID=A0AAE1I817_9HYPO|nr:hypothetical protein Triagg1_9869 [Trichoderma aggressivum f. europaeum]